MEVYRRARPGCRPGGNVPPAMACCRCVTRSSMECGPCRARAGIVSTSSRRGHAVHLPCHAFHLPCPARHLPCQVLDLPCPVCHLPCHLFDLSCPISNLPWQMFALPRHFLCLPRPILRLPCHLFLLSCPIFHLPWQVFHLPRPVLHLPRRCSTCHAISLACHARFQICHAICLACHAMCSRRDAGAPRRSWLGRLAVLPLLPVGGRAMGEEGRGDEGEVRRRAAEGCSVYGLPLRAGDAPRGSPRGVSTLGPVDRRPGGRPPTSSRARRTRARSSFPGGRRGPFA